MKKIAYLHLFLILVCSCRKNYDCTCTETTSLPNIYWSSDSTLYSNATTYEYSVVNYPFKSFKKNSESKCSEHESDTVHTDIYGSNYFGDDRTLTTNCVLSKK
ncbi:MAG: hypothetical protein HYU67_10010 [Flavobacteriia bacterium]|nr:hypothetical protein [Flavobacteriia bacterium]